MQSTSGEDPGQHALHELAQLDPRQLGVGERLVDQRAADLGVWVELTASPARVVTASDPLREASALKWSAPAIGPARPRA